MDQTHLATELVCAVDGTKCGCLLLVYMFTFSFFSLSEKDGTAFTK